VLLIVSGWVRYAATAPSLDGKGESAWGVLMVAQVLVGLSQPFTLCLGSEYARVRWDASKEVEGTRG
jgi:hypothetical protein